MQAFEKAPPDVQEILSKPIKELGLTLEGSPLERSIQKLYRELERKGIRKFRPLCYLTDEWGCPSGEPVIGIPFYLANPKLARLEKEMNDLEDEREIMMYLRHEAGHAFNYAYHLYGTPEWRELFGPFRRPYRESYRPVPFSKRYVRHIDGWYAQKHPDEDFAETFAVWLTPRSNWRRRYAGWPALKKLQYVDELMAEIATQKPLLTRRLRVDPLSRLTQTLAEHYEKKRAHYAIDYPKIYDRDLRRIFSADPRHHRSPAASSFLRRNRAKIRQIVSKWTGEYQLTLDAVLNDMIGRCRELKLRAVGSERQLRMEFIVLLTAKTVHSLYSPSRRQWLAL